VIGFDLTPASALPLLRRWNETHCEPPWDEADLVRKLEYADAHVQEPRGHLRRERGTATTIASAATGTPFPLAVPDVVLADWSVVRPRTWSTRRGRRPAVNPFTIGWTLLLAVAQQRRNPVVLPLPALGTLFWEPTAAGGPRTGATG